MSVNSATSTTSSTTSTNSTSPQAASQAKTQEETKTSFNEELKNAKGENQQEEQNVKEGNVEQAKSEGEKEETKSDTTVLKGNLYKNTDEILDIELNSTDLLSLNIQQLLDTQTQISNRNNTILQINISQNENLLKNVGQTLNYKTIEMSENDAQFFVDVVQNNTEGTVQNVVQEIQQGLDYGTEEVQKSATVSKALLDALQNSAKTGQAVRIDFGNDVAVVMRISRDGSILANFIPGDKAVEEYLKNNIEFLKQRFDEENIKYSQLSYSQHQGQEQKRQQNKEDKQ